MNSDQLISAKSSAPDTGVPQADVPAATEDRPPTIPDTLPILPTRDTVLFPGTVLSLTIGRPAFRKLLEESLPQSKIIGAFTQKNPKQDNPDPDDLHRVGVAAAVLKLIRQADDQVIIVVSVLERIAIRKVLLTHPFIHAEIEVLPSIQPPKDDKQFEATVQQLRESALQLIGLSPEVSEQARTLLSNLEDPGRLADLLAGSLNIDTSQKQDLLEELDVVKRVRAVLVRVSTQLEIAQLQQKIQKDVAAHFTDAQRRAFLREQLKTIQKELGESEEGAEQQIVELRKHLEEAKPPKEVMDQAERELRRLSHCIPPARSSPSLSATSRRSPNCLGASSLRITSTWVAPGKSSTATTSISRRLSAVSLSFWPCASSIPPATAPSFAFAALRGSAKRASANPSLTRSAGNSSA